LINCLLLCARFVIYKCKFGERIPTIFEFKQTVQHLKHSEPGSGKDKT